MQRNTTLEPASELSPTQLQVLSSLLTGRTVTNAAAAAKVDRTTVHRWLKDDFEFIAALNRGRKQLRQETEARLLNLAIKATKTIEKAITGGDITVSLVVLKGLGLLSGSSPVVGPEDAQELRDQVERERQQSSFMRALGGGF